MKTFATTATAAATLALFVAVSLTAQAAEPTSKAVDSATTRSAQVPFAELDLSTDQGQQAMQERLHQTARRLCAQVADPNDLSHHTNFVKCVADITERARVAVQVLARKDSSRSLARN